MSRISVSRFLARMWKTQFWKAGMRTDQIRPHKKSQKRVGYIAPSKRYCTTLAPFQGADESCPRNPGRCPGLSTAGAFSAGILNPNCDDTRRRISCLAERQVGQFFLDPFSPGRV